MLDLADRLGAAGEAGLLATLVHARGSSYRPVGSMMLAGPPGTPRAGGVSGGCLEEFIARRGRTLLETHPAALLGFDTTADGDLDTARPTLGCGAHVDVLVERFTIEHRALLSEMLQAARSGPALIVQTSVHVGVDQTPDRFVQVERQRVTTGAFLASGAREDLRTGSAFQFKQRVDPQPRLMICGAGDDVPAVAQFAASTDWSTLVVDRRARLVSRARYPDADDLRIVDGDWTELADLARPGDHVVLMTHDLADDIAICHALADASLASIGILGPAHRMSWIREALRSRGVRFDFIESLRGPIGLDLGGRSPEQIALSVVAELSAIRHARPGGPLSSGAARLHPAGSAE